MAVMGLSLPDHFDGTIPPNLLRLDISEMKGRPKRFERPDVSLPGDEEKYGSDELSEIADRLRALGYLE